MKYHDYHLRSYLVSDFGKTIKLDLVYDYPNSSKDESVIIFSGVVFHNFIQTGGTIIDDIVETRLSEISKNLKNNLVEWATQYGGLVYFNRDIELWLLKMENEGYKAWTIYSSPGFIGDVIAKSVK